MPAIVTNKFRLFNARQFKNAFDDIAGTQAVANSASHIYVFVGRVHSWAEKPLDFSGFNDTTVPVPPASFQGNEYDPWRSMLGLQKVANTNVTLATKRNNWTSGTVYSIYDDESAAIPNLTSTYFVYADSHVFKCLDNNEGGESTTKPTVPGAAQQHVPFRTADNYKWKYMYSIPVAESDQFLMNNFMPVRTLSTYELANLPTGYEGQKRVQEGVVDGTIDAIVMQSGKNGSGYFGAEGDSGVLTVYQGTGLLEDKTTLRLSTGAIADKVKLYNNAAIYLSNSSYSTVAIIEEGPVEEDGGSRSNVRLTTAVTDLSTTSGVTNWTIGPQVTIEGDGIYYANAVAAITSAVGAVADTGAPVAGIRVANTGQGYTTANVIIHPIDNGLQSAPGGSGAQARAIIAPKGGHGSDHEKELGGYHVIIAQTFQNYGHANALPISNEFRQIGLIQNALLRPGAILPTEGTIPTGTSWIANAALGYNQMHRLEIDAGTPLEFTPGSEEDQRLRGQESGVTGIVVDYDTRGDKLVRLTSVTANSSGGGFHPGEILERISTSTETFVSPFQKITSKSSPTVAYTTGDLLPFSGEILYVENRQPITHTSDQKEEIKIIFEF